MKVILFKIYCSIFKLFLNVISLFNNLFIALFLRKVFLKMLGIKASGKIFIDYGFDFYNPRNISFGNNISLGHYNKLWAFNKIEFGDNIQSAIGLTIVSGSHNTNNYSGLVEGQNVLIEGENWIGANVTILGGVTIGRGSIIAAGAVVVKDIPKYSIAAGIPAKVIKERNPDNIVFGPFGNYTPEFFN